MKQNIGLTKRAAQRLKELLETRAKNPDQRLRLVTVPGAQTVLVLDEPRKEDKVIKIDGTPVLVIEPSVASVLEGAIIDYTDTPEGRRLTLTK